MSQGLKTPLLEAKSRANHLRMFTQLSLPTTLDGWSNLSLYDLRIKLLQNTNGFESLKNKIASTLNIDENTCEKFTASHENNVKSLKKWIKKIREDKLGNLVGNSNNDQALARLEVNLEKILPAKKSLWDRVFSKADAQADQESLLAKASINSQYGTTSSFQAVVVHSAQHPAGTASSSRDNSAADLRRPLLGPGGSSSSYYQADSQSTFAAPPAAAYAAAAPAVTQPQGYKHLHREGEKELAATSTKATDVHAASSHKDSQARGHSALGEIRVELGRQGFVSGATPRLLQPSAIHSTTERPPLPTDLVGWEKLSKHELDNALNDLEDFASLETAVVSALRVSDLKEQKTLLESKEVHSLEKQHVPIQALKNWLVTIDPNHDLLIKLKTNLQNLQQAVLGQQSHQQPKLNCSPEMEKASEEQAAKQQATPSKRSHRVPLPTEIGYWVKLNDNDLALLFTPEKFAASLTTIIQAVLKKLIPAHEQTLLSARTRLPLVITEQSNKFDRITKLLAWINNILVNIDQLSKIQKKLQRLIEAPIATRSTSVVVPPPSKSDAQATAAPVSSRSSSSSAAMPAAAAHPSSSAASATSVAKIEVEKLSLVDWANLSEDKLFDALDTSKNIGILRTLILNVAATKRVLNPSNRINILTMEKRLPRVEKLITVTQDAIKRITDSQSAPTIELGQQKIALETLKEKLDNIIAVQQDEIRALTVLQQLEAWKNTDAGQGFATFEKQEMQRRAMQKAAEDVRIAALSRPAHTTTNNSSSGTHPPLPTRTLLTTATAPKATGAAIAVMPVKQEEEELNLQGWAELDEKQLEEKLNSRRAFALLRKAIIVYAPKAPPVDQKSLDDATLFAPEDKNSRSGRIRAVLVTAIAPARQALAQTGDPNKEGELLNSLEPKLRSILTRLEPPARQAAAAPVASSSAPRAMF